jgi:hypothetical protein
LFFTNIPIDPKVLRQEQKFQIRHQGLQHIQIKIKKKREEKKEKKKKKEKKWVIINREELATSARSVASLNSIVAGTDFIKFK